MLLEKLNPRGREEMSSEKSCVKGKGFAYKFFPGFTESFSKDKAQAICKHRTLAKRAYERTFKDK